MMKGVCMGLYLDTIGIGAFFALMIIAIVNGIFKGTGKCNIYYMIWDLKRKSFVLIPNQIYTNAFHKLVYRYTKI